MSEFLWGEARLADLPTVTLFCGLPGSGKTTLAECLEADGRGIRLCTDDWQRQLGVDHTDTDFHNRLQPLLYRHALTLLRHGVSVILEDGLWMAEERAEKFRDARACGSRIEFHVFSVPYDTLWNRLQDRNQEAPPGGVPDDGGRVPPRVGPVSTPVTSGVGRCGLLSVPYGRIGLEVTKYSAPPLSGWNPLLCRPLRLRSVDRSRT